MVEGVVGLEDYGLCSTFSSQQIITSKLLIIKVVLQVLDLLINLSGTAAFGALLIVGI